MNLSLSNAIYRLLIEANDEFISNLTLSTADSKRLIYYDLMLSTADGKTMNLSRSIMLSMTDGKTRNISQSMLSTADNKR